MCVVSMIYDHYSDKWQKYVTLPTYPPVPPPVPSPLTREEIEEFRELLRRAREYDRKHHEPDCELAEKKERLRKLAADLGVEIALP